MKSPRRMESQRIIRVLYHSPCPDGAFAALAAHLRFREEKDIKFVPHTTYNKLDYKESKLFSKSSEVYLLDYIGPKNFCSEISSQVKKVTLLDHHKTAQEIIDSMKKENNVPSNLEVHLDMKKSGATISWDFFNKEKELVPDPKKKSALEKMYAYIEDNDIWKRELPFTKEFSIGLGAKEIEYDIDKNPKLFHQLLDLDFDELITLGKQKAAEIQKIISDELATAFKISLGGPSKREQLGTCLAVFTKHPEHKSEMGNQLAIKSQKEGLRGIGAIVYTEEQMQDKSKYKISLRSVPEEDTTVISQMFGGGGHKNASSFALDCSEFMQWKQE